MVGPRADDSDTDPVALVPASKAVDDIYAVAGVEVVDCPFTVDAPSLQQSGQIRVHQNAPSRESQAPHDITERRLEATTHWPMAGVIP